MMQEMPRSLKASSSLSSWVVTVMDEQRTANPAQSKRVYISTRLATVTASVSFSRFPSAAVSMLPSVICSGTAGLTKLLARECFESKAVDKSVSLLSSCESTTRSQGPMSIKLKPSEMLGSTRKDFVLRNDDIV